MSENYNNLFINIFEYQFSKYKEIIYIFIICLGVLCSCNQVAEKNNIMPKNSNFKKNGAQAVVIAELIHSGDNGDKFLWDTVRILEVLYNKTTSHFQKEIEVAYYSTEAGLPKNVQCILYLEPYPMGSEYNDEDGWMLLGGGRATGVEMVE